MMLGILDMSKVDKKNLKKLKQYFKKTTKVSEYIKQNSGSARGLCNEPSNTK